MFSGSLEKEKPVVSWEARYPGAIRAVNSEVLDAYLLKARADPAPRPPPTPGCHRAGRAASASLAGQAGAAGALGAAPRGSCPWHCAGCPEMDTQFLHMTRLPCPPAAPLQPHPLQC